MSKTLLFVVLTLIAAISFAQDTDQQLANHYYNEGDCEKALPYLEKTFKKNPSKIIFQRYIHCLKEIGNDREILKVIEEQTQRAPDNYEYKVILAKEYERQDRQRKADKIIDDIIQNLPGSPREIINAQKAFSEQGDHERALSVLKQGRRLLGNNYPLNAQFAQVYGDLGETKKMINEYISLLDYNASMLTTLKRVMPRMIDFESEDSESFELLKNQLIRAIQKNPNTSSYNRLLIWSLIQRKNFSAALIQAKALDKRTSNNGKEVFNLGRIASKNKAYPTARKAFQYVIELGNDSPYYYSAEKQLLNTQFKAITTTNDYSQDDLDATIANYRKTLQRIDKNGRAIPIIEELAYILAYYADQKKEAVTILKEALEYPRYNDIGRAKIKVLLADIYVLQNNIWDASLLYMQVEKQFKYETIGDEAKFKNARIFYYDGDFKYAQSQLDVLKSSTSKVIANDAMNLSLLITENLGLDSNYFAMEQFASADLLLQQHQFDTAFQMLDSITAIFPEHNLADDILMRKADAHIFLSQWQLAIKQLEKIATNHKDDILADDALYKIGQIYENQQLNYEKAAEYYFKIMKAFPGSLFATKARKRYRELE